MVMKKRRRDYRKKWGGAYGKVVAAYWKKDVAYKNTEVLEKGLNQYRSRKDQSGRDWASRNLNSAYCKASGSVKSEVVWESGWCILKSERCLLKSEKAY